MKIWRVFVGDEADCAWSNKQDAVNYLKEEAKLNGWHLSPPLGNKNEENDDWLTYKCTYENCMRIVYIEPMFLDEKPYYYEDEDD